MKTLQGVAALMLLLLVSSFTIHAQPCGETTLHPANEGLSSDGVYAASFDMSICADCGEAAAMGSVVVGSFIGFITAPMLFRRRKAWPTIVLLHEVVTRED